PDREPRPVQRAQYGPRSGDGRDRRLHRRRRLPRPALAHLSRGHVPLHVARRSGWSEHRPAGRWTDRRVRRARAGGARSRPSERLPGGAHSWLQHGVPQSPPRGDRRVRPAVPHRRRRRGRVLVPPGTGLDTGIQRRRHGLAPPPQLGAHLLEAADRVRPRGGDARTEVAQEIQWLRARALGRPYLRQRAGPRAPVAPSARLSRHLGRRAVPVPVRARPEPARGAAADAGMVSPDRDPGGAVNGEPGLEPAPAPAAAARRRRPAVVGAGLPERGPRFFQRGAAPQFGPAEASVVDGGALPAPATGAPAWPARVRSDALAEAGRAWAGVALADPSPLE